MDGDFLVPIVVGTSFIITTGSVILLRPVTKQLAAYLRVLAEQKRGPAAPAELSRLEDALARIDDRLTLLEERQRFAEELMRARVSAGALPNSRQDVVSSGGRERAS